MDAIPADNESGTEFELPSAVKSALSTFMIADSYQAHEAKDDGPKHKALMEWAADGGGSDGALEIMEEFLYDDWRETPDLKFQITYETSRNEKVTKHLTIKSIYSFVLPAMWWPREDGRTLLGGSGILSYENPNQPDKGHYNERKSRQEING